jgi:hypothetical protein
LLVPATAAALVPSISSDLYLLLSLVAVGSSDSEKGDRVYK